MNTDFSQPFNPEAYAPSGKADMRFRRYVEKGMPWFYGIVFPVILAFACTLMRKKHFSGYKNSTSSCRTVLLSYARGISGRTLQWAACFLTQFFYYPAVGTALLIAVWVCICFVMCSAFRLSPLWSFLPALGYDHGIYTEEEDKKYYKYGGNYGDFPTNGNFCIDGILMPDRTPSPGMEEYKQIIAPVEITAVEGSMNKLQIRNYYDFLNLDTTTLYWEVKAEDQTIQDGIVERLSVAPHEGKIIALPITAFELQENTDYYLNLTVCQKKKETMHQQGMKSRSPDSDADPKDGFR